MKGGRRQEKKRKECKKEEEGEALLCDAEGRGFRRTNVRI